MDGAEALPTLLAELLYEDKVLSDLVENALISTNPVSRTSLEQTANVGQANSRLVDHHSHSTLAVMWSRAVDPNWVRAVDGHAEDGSIVREAAIHAIATAQRLAW